MACNRDIIDVVRLDGWPAGTLTGEELDTGTVSEGIKIGFAETRLKRRNGRALERCMAFGRSIFWKQSIRFVLIAEDEEVRKRGKTRLMIDKWTFGS